MARCACPAIGPGLAHEARAEGDLGGVGFERLAQAERQASSPQGCSRAPGHPGRRSAYMRVGLSSVLAGAHERLLPGRKASIDVDWVVVVVPSVACSAGSYAIAADGAAAAAAITRRPASRPSCGASRRSLSTIEARLRASCSPAIALADRDPRAGRHNTYGAGLRVWTGPPAPFTRRRGQACGRSHRTA